jgi:hypothetical protein
MKVSVLKDKEKPYGIELTADTEADKVILRRFWDGGVKVNSIAGDRRELHLTFADLIGT